MLDDLPGALWTREMFDNHRRDTLPEMQRIVVAVDPSGTARRMVATVSGSWWRAKVSTGGSTQWLTGRASYPLMDGHGRRCAPITSLALIGLLLNATLAAQWLRRLSERLTPM